MKYLPNFAIAALHCALTVVAIASDIGKSYQLYHKFGPSSQLTPRGKIFISPSEDGNGLSATFIAGDAVKLDVDKLDSMVEDGALYTVVVIEDGDDKSSSKLSLSSVKDVPHVSASVPGCSLRRSNLREEISLSISPTGKLQSVSYRPLISALAPKTCNNLKPLSEKPEAIYGREGNDDSFPFKTTVEFESHKPMPSIPTVLPQTRPPAGLKWYRRNAKNNPNPFLGGSKVENKGGIPFVDEEAPSGFKSSFLYKYWYIIMPLAIMGLFGGVEEEPAQDARRGAPAVAATSAVAAAAGGTAAAATGEQVRQRRGKRD